MKKNKILFLVFVVALLVSTIGCTTKKPMRTQTRIGVESPGNDAARRKNTNMMGVDRRNMDNISGMGPTTTDNVVRRNTAVRPNTTVPNTTTIPPTTTDMTRRSTVVAPNTTVTRASTIAQRVADLSEVNKCSVVINDNTALVGVDLKSHVEGKMTTDLKRRIETTVKNTDSSIKHVSVTADPNLYTRISNMVTDIERGKPISGFAGEIKEILRRITPVK